MAGRQRLADHVFGSHFGTEELGRDPGDLDSLLVVRAGAGERRGGADALQTVVAESDREPAGSSIATSAPWRPR